ncbi:MULTISPECIES: hypothetical protein [Salipiger]|uniref:hypothetical protein n=1 Tax=Salipiger TaxID=263377 RepID=UPI0035124245
MAKQHTSASLPVESDSMQAEFQAAFARMAVVPAGRTLIDEISEELWLEEVTANIAAGSAAHCADELDDADAPVKEIA